MNPLRFHHSCPDCGFVIDRENKVFAAGKPFDCGRCGAHYSHDDFFKETEEKAQAQHHNHATADLSGEEDE